MMRSMFAGVSGMRSHQMMMDVVSDNIANVNTVGFKSSRVVFQDTMSQLLREGSPGSPTTGTTNPTQIGLGVHINAVDVINTQGAIQNTGRSTDLAIQNGGLFVVSFDGSQLYTRAGSFNEDGQHRLADPSGALLQGWSTDATGAFPTPAPGTPGAPAPTTLQIPQVAPDDPTLPLKSYAIGIDGTVTATYSDDVPRVIGQIAMATFPNTAGLVKTGDGHLRSSPAAGPPDVGVAGQGSRGTLSVGSLEMSNVDLALEFTNLMIAQRGFQANSRVISTSDDLLQELVNLKR